MPYEAMDVRITIRATEDLRGRLQAMAEKDGVAMSDVARDLIYEGLGSSERYTEYRSQIANLQEQNENLIRTFVELLDRADILEDNFNKCVLSLMSVLQGGASEVKMKEIMDYFYPYAILAQRQMEKRQQEHEYTQAVIKRATEGAGKTADE